MSDIEKIRKELFGKGRWTFGGDGSHWDGCDETHWDCALVHLTARIAELESKIARLVEAGDRMAENWIANFDGEHFDDCPVTLWQRAKEER